MSQGLQVWNSAGELVLDTTQRVIKYVTADEIVEGTTTNVPINIDVTSSAIAAPVSVANNNYTPQVTFTTGNAEVTWPSVSSTTHFRVLPDGRGHHGRHVP
jgi:uncharacterized protein (DUF2342 family)